MHHAFLGRCLSAKLSLPTRPLLFAVITRHFWMKMLSVGDRMNDILFVQLGGDAGASPVSSRRDSGMRAAGCEREEQRGGAERWIELISISVRCNLLNRCDHEQGRLQGRLEIEMSGTHTTHTPTAPRPGVCMGVCRVYFSLFVYYVT